MSGTREAAKKGLRLGFGAVSHAGWWLRWQTGRPAWRAVTQLEPRPARTATAARRAA